ncbi:MAG TPA: hypothetical protein VK434_17490 [Microvirga sp.]|nr:hypothetical protein [Microvirga sp.]
MTAEGGTTGECIPFLGAHARDRCAPADPVRRTGERQRRKPSFSGPVRTIAKGGRIKYYTPLETPRFPFYLNPMPHDHHHRHAPRVIAAEPTFSLLRLSAWQRLAGAAVGLGGLWLLVFWVMG